MKDKKEKKETKECPISCDLCGTMFLDRNCKLACPNCGYMRDCSDP